MNWLVKTRELHCVVWCLLAVPGSLQVVTGRSVVSVPTGGLEEVKQCRFIVFKSKVKFTLGWAMKARRGSGGITLLFL
jgi:hypothetical protein